VVAGQHAGDPIVIALRERSRHLALDSFGTGGPCYPLFGSGSAGLGKANYESTASTPAVRKPGRPFVDEVSMICPQKLAYSLSRSVVSGPMRRRKARSPLEIALEIDKQLCYPI